MTTNPPAGEPSPWSQPTSGYPGPTSGQPNPVSGYPAPGSGYPNAGYPADQSGYPNQGYPAAPGYPNQSYPATPNYPNQGYPQAAGYQAPGAWDTPGIAAYPATLQPTNGLATASLVTSIVSVSLCAGAFGFVGALMGHSARRQIRTSGEGGDGLATAGIVVGWIGFALFLLGVLAVVGIAVIGYASAASTSP
jgi:hypothetical protein